MIVDFLSTKLFKLVLFPVAAVAVMQAVGSWIGLYGSCFAMLKTCSAVIVVRIKRNFVLFLAMCLLLPILCDVVSSLATFWRHHTRRLRIREDDILIAAWIMLWAMMMSFFCYVETKLPWILYILPNVLVTCVRLYLAGIHSVFGSACASSLPSCLLQKLKHARWDAYFQGMLTSGQLEFRKTKEYAAICFVHVVPFLIDINMRDAAFHDAHRGPLICLCAYFVYVLVWRCMLDKTLVRFGTGNLPWKLLSRDVHTETRYDCPDNTCSVCLDSLSTTTSSIANAVSGARRRAITSACRLQPRLACAISVARTDAFVGSTRQIAKLPCGHMFHKDCLASVAESHQRCPMCRCPWGSQAVEDFLDMFHDAVASWSDEHMQVLLCGLLTGSFYIVFQPAGLSDPWYSTLVAIFTFGAHDSLANSIRRVLRYLEINV